MNDRELTELAAKAAGYYDLGEWDERRGCLTNYEGWTFDPLEDDGDALRLAVKLLLEIERSKHCEGVVYVGEVGDAKLLERANDATDIFAATRLAITRAAAEIGRAMTTESVD